MNTTTSLLLAAEIERQLIRVEAESGSSVSFASRPLTEIEKQAGTRFGDIDAIVEKNTFDGVGLITALYAAAAAAIIVELFGDDEDDDAAVDDTDEDDAVEAAVIVAALTLLLGRKSTQYERVREKTEPRLHELIMNSYLGGIFTVLDEATRQNVNADRFRRPDIPDALKLLATDVAGHPLRRTVERTIATFETPQHQLGKGVTYAELITVIEQTSQKGTVDLLHQANQSALGTGRNDTANSFVGDFIAAFASELLDGNTCARCRSIDGTRFDTVEDAEAAYGTGSYVNCLGGSRCRGVLVWVYEEPATD